MWMVVGGVGVGRKAVATHFMDGFEVVNYIWTMKLSAKVTV